MQDFIRGRSDIDLLLQHNIELDQLAAARRMFVNPTWELIDQSMRTATLLADAARENQSALQEHGRMNRAVAEAFRVIERDRSSIGAFARSGEAYWRSRVTQVVDSTSAALVSDSLFRLHTGSLAAASLAATAIAARLPWDRVGLLTSASEAARSLLMTSHLDFSVSCSSLFEELAGTPRQFGLMPPVVTAAPPAELFRATRVMAVVTPMDAPVASFADDELASAMDDDVEQSLEALLAETHPDLLAALRGARRAVASTEPDGIRHASVSLREMLSHLLHRVAPDDAIRAWTSDPSMYHDEKPTRAARFKFALRALANPAFEKVVQADAKNLTAVFEALNSGTHSAPASLTVPQLKVLIIRVEGFAQTLMLASHPRE